VQFADFACDLDASNLDWELDKPKVFEEVGPFSNIPVDENSFES